jgi:hypothetical protein
MLLQMEVIGMFKIRKIGSESEASKLEKSKLRLLKSSQAFPASLVTVESADEENVYGSNRTDIRNAMLDAEFKKAMGLVAFQNNRHPY